MKSVLKLLFILILFGLIVSWASAVASSSNDEGLEPTNNVDDTISIDNTATPTVGAPGPMTLPPSLNVRAMSAQGVGIPTISRMYVYVRKNDFSVSRTQIPVTGATITVKQYEIVYLSLWGRYQGPSGTYGIMDIFNSGTYPLQGVRRVESAVTMASDNTEYNIKSQPFWAINKGTWYYYLEVFGGGSFKTARIYINVI